MASFIYKPCYVTARHLRLSLRSWIVATQNFSAQSNSASDQDAFGQLAEEFQEKNIRTDERKKRVSSVVRRPRQKQEEWTEKFGTLTPRLKSVVLEPTSNIDYERSWSNSIECGEEMKSLVKEGKLSRAFELLDTVCHSDDVRPNTFLFNILIGACGRLGDTKQAFKLYRKMKERGISPDESTYTSLFNSCANCPSKQEGHRQALQLYKKIQSQGYVPNTTNYLAMLKAFGRCNDLQTTFRIADEMKSAGHLLDARVLESLLSACITDEQSGFSRALQVWRRFRQKRIQPSLHAYHLLLRAFKDCGTGSAPLPAEQLYLEKWTPAMLSDTETTAVAATPNVETPESRLAAVGGISAFLSNLENDNLQPDVLTFTNLLLLLPDSTEAENLLLSSMKQYRVKPDTGLCNALIKRRNFRGDYTAALDVLSQMQTDAIVPDLLTFGVLALGCNTKRDAQHLLRDMQVAGFRPNINIFGALVKNACWCNNWSYASEMLAKMQEHQVLPNERLLKRIEQSIARTKENLVLMEKGQKVPSIYTKFNRPEIVQQFELFLIVYKGWLQVTPISPECCEQRTEAKR